MHTWLRNAALLLAILPIGTTTGQAQQAAGAHVGTSARAAWAEPRPIRAAVPIRAEIVASDPVAASGALYHDWTFDGEAGERVRIILRSNVFDAYLKLGRWIDGTYYEDVADDDGDEGTDARIETVLYENGTYTIRAQSLFAGETGRYTLLFERIGGGSTLPIRAYPSASAPRSE